MVFTKATTKKVGRPSKSMKTEFESVIRTGGRVKKAKKVFDPSENNPRKRRAENANCNLQSSKTQKRKKVAFSYYKRKKLLAQTIQEDFCTICSKKSNNLIHCQDCNLKVHKECIKTNFKNLKLLETKWRCDNCKSCSTCYENAEKGPLITCSVCVDYFHYICHIPNISSNEENNINWICTKCLPKPQFKPSILKSRRNTISSTLVRETFTQNTINNDSSNSVKNINLHNNNNNSDDKMIDSDNDDDDYDDEYNDDDNNDDEEYNETNENIDNDKINQTHKKKIKGVVPDVSKWSCDQLASFIKDYFPSEAAILREQEIDGASLLLLARSDVINGLKLKLGPAIRLYSFITKLQTKKIDPTATWFY